MMAKRKLEVHLVFNLTSKFHRFFIYHLKISDNNNNKGGHLGWRMEGGGVMDNFLNGPTKDNWCSSF